MNGMRKMLSEMHLALSAVVMMIVIVAAVQIADAPALEVLNQDDISRFIIDDNGRITDRDGRLRGWLRGNEVYGPDMAPKYRLSGVHLTEEP
jgi:hypothetical protein